MEKIMRPVWAEIDLDILANNMRNIKKLAGNKEVMAGVKADAYGHGYVNSRCFRCSSLPFRKWCFKTSCCNAY